MKRLTYDEVEDILSKGDMCGEIFQPLFNLDKYAEFIYDIEISGDWKHTHRYLDYLMKDKGYECVDEREIHDDYTDDGDDYYTSVHRFVHKDYVALYNGVTRK